MSDCPFLQHFTRWPTMRAWNFSLCTHYFVWPLLLFLPMIGFSFFCSCPLISISITITMPCCALLLYWIYSYQMFIMYTIITSLYSFVLYFFYFFLLFTTVSCLGVGTACTSFSFVVFFTTINLSINQYLGFRKGYL